jgi:methylated-DNA-[protein]-cysteine S-methyltransferase
MTDLERRLSQPGTPTVDPARVTAELARRADVAGLLDVAWATLDTPLGPIAVFVTPRGLVRVA